ncbi:DNA mismatch repair endonuclease MutL [Eubacterium sp. am_0171]|uniref:DNA mismatch repair protein MutL n=1 Tax=Faecalicatena contorta TaxID=39482 RepID=A0A174II29_9FIRM|nr:MULTISPECIES: DNA mismatch repair endonuclease MutL [Clostridia]MSC82693.1 DNA mismatch repair endonuclease MutL [Eubacterium sp. BIOML-A1]MSD04950.1 DNA mismatch repair endonuclease MutL [Eubacterium sp. BIOML-A2]RYT25405.1 DNA mismatch repair endonuclease MutL [Eubacterium sp. am_0171]CUO84599.1 DNA mismatch repair protein mutL [[Eubacterium] contortum] [Faecalicatena contorta]
MPHIQVLDQITIDKIAAGEVIERPASIVKELVENAIDARATAVVVEIQEGGISFIRIMDNGDGILREDVPNAFLRHSTSKIRAVEDLSHIESLGFRGEALSSIAAVTQVELITKRREDTLGTRYLIEGGKEQLIEDTGAPDGTTFLIRQLFYNVPARRKFLKTPMTEAGHIQDLLMRLALSHPEVSFQFINNGQEKLRTAGNGRLKDVIYSIYGREVAANLIEMDYGKGGIHITGYLGKPTISRGNRNFENFFVNGRYVKSAMISKAIEDAYRDFVMQHKFPFVVLHFHINGEDIDVNVHPTKMELRFQRQQEVYNTVYEAVHRTLLEPELIPVVDVPEPPKAAEEAPSGSPFLLRPKAGAVSDKGSPMTAGKQESAEMAPEEKNEDYFLKKMRERVLSYHNRASSAEVSDIRQIHRPDEQTSRIREAAEKRRADEQTTHDAKPLPAVTIREAGDIPSSAWSDAAPTHLSEERAVYGENPEPSEKPKATEKPEAPEKPEQLNLFDEKLLKREVKAEYKLIGQVFDTYWLVQFHDSLYIIDQHAAHERVLYERTLKGMKNREFTSQYLSPPVILSLSMQETELLNEHMDRFKRIGFEIEPFGGDEYAVRAIPDNLFGIAKKELLLEMLDGLADGITTSMTPELIDEKVASMSCKAAVKGNNRLSAMEVDTLIQELLELDNPYHCPHGRPTIIAMTKRELEKKFKRII